MAWKSILLGYWALLRKIEMKGKKSTEKREKYFFFSRKIIFRLSFDVGLAFQFFFLFFFFHLFFASITPSPPPALILQGILAKSVVFAIFNILSESLFRFSYFVLVFFLFAVSFEHFKMDSFCCALSVRFLLDTLYAKF